MYGSPRARHSLDAAYPVGWSRLSLGFYFHVQPFGSEFGGIHFRILGGRFLQFVAERLVVTPESFDVQDWDGDVVVRMIQNCVVGRWCEFACLLEDDE